MKRLIAAFAGAMLAGQAFAGDLKPAAEEPAPPATVDAILDVLGASPSQHRLAAAMKDPVVIVPRIIHDKALADKIGDFLRMSAPLTDRTRPANFFAPGDPCYVYSVTRPGGLNDLLKALMPIPIEREVIVPERELALFVLFHELGHCGQSDYRTRTPADYESEADVSGIKAVLAGNPDSDVASGVLAMRALMPDGYESSLTLFYRLSGYPIPPKKSMRSAYDELMNLRVALYPALRKRFFKKTNFVEAGFLAHIATDMTIARMKPSQAGVLTRQWAKLFVDTYYYLSPKLAARVAASLDKPKLKSARADGPF